MRDMSMIVAVGIGTYLFRLSAVAVFHGARTIPVRVERSLRLIAPAVLAALVANSLILDGDGFRSFGAWYGAAIVAATVAVWTRSAAWTLLSGMIAVWVFSALG
jgi:branched-subunit amino acid transport protein